MSERRLVCPSRKWGVAIDATGVWEIRCLGMYCKLSNGEGVIHRFDLASGDQRTRPEHEPYVANPRQGDNGNGRNADF